MNDEGDEEERGVWVKLGFSELVIGAVIGCLRHIEALTRGRKHRAGFNGDGWGAHVEGAYAEMAAAKVLDRYWSGPLNTFRDGPGDVGPYEVRRRSDQSYDALVRPWDASEKVHIAVFGCAPNFRVAGWIWGHEAKRDEWVQTHADREAAWFVPQKELHDLSTLP